MQAILGKILATYKTDPQRALALVSTLLGMLKQFPEAVGLLAPMLPKGPLEAELSSEPTEVIAFLEELVEAFNKHPKVFLALAQQLT